MQLTRAQRAVVDRLRELGGVAVLGSGVDRENPAFDASAYIGTVRKVFGNREAKRIGRLIEKHKVPAFGVWLSGRTYTKLINGGVIVPVDELPGVFRLDESKAAG